MNPEAALLACAFLCAIVCISCTLISVKLYTEWVKYGILKDKK